ncbi:pectinesterase family protein [Sphingosinicella sp. BN140058]|uniref:pectinesterase family protein n=1 Tax=Sphingosinicella sp. BN140058 TaxID=1892855 RepID=UPI001010B0F8|nr:pectinesterase family protein [Sphingosinicella sp. BN140058]QAY79545.1 pectin esterase [Sphingosinicella sp. BN140058]
MKALLAAIMIAGCLLTGAAPPAQARDLIVSASERGAYRSVQAAIDALPADGGVVRIAPGTWREKLTISGPGVTLIGTGKRPDATILVYGDSAKSAGGTFNSATVTASGDDLRIANLTIQNDWWLVPGNPPSQAVALSLTGDRAVVTRVRLLGHQDTLFANKGKNGRMARHYFSNCYIEGHVDFIFGNAKAYFRECRIHGLAHGDVWYTAQSRASAEEDSGYVFDRCTLTADPAARNVSLGRPWRDYASVVFLRTRMDAQVMPEGWREWYPGTSNRLPTTRYAEYRSFGRGANPAARAAPARQLTREEAAGWSLRRFFDGDIGWIDAGLKQLRRG